MNEKIELLQKEMERQSMDAYIIVSDDFHGSEYVGDYFKARAFMSGFTGSAGTLVVLKKAAYLWTDGRYFLQAQKQLQGSEIDLMKSGEAGVPSIPHFLKQKLEKKAIIGFDARTISKSFIDQLDEALGEMQIQYKGNLDLVDAIWKHRPEISKKPVWELPQCYAGLSRLEKIEELKAELERSNVDYLLVTALEDIAWLLNLRGDDVACTPVFLGYMLFAREDIRLYVHADILGVYREPLEQAGISIREYNQIYKDLEQLPDCVSLQYDPANANFALLQHIPKTINVLSCTSPIGLKRAIKNPVEMENERIAHRKDGVAVTRFMKWLKENVALGTYVTELSAAEKLEQFREEMEHYVGPSFEPIIAYGEHGAIVHYSATKESDVRIENRGLCLADTGGHYLEGSTDITRTIALGEVSEEEKKMFTLVLKGHLQLAHAVFKENTIGANLDVLARGTLWQEGIDFNHGTGHGVGYLLSVHEGPHRIHYNMLHKKCDEPLKEGVIISNEPGFYLAGAFGIRHENLELVINYKSTEYGQFMKFETLTLVPFDVDAIQVELLTAEEKVWLNEYHKVVYDTLREYLTKEECQWLQGVTRAL